MTIEQLFKYPVSLGLFLISLPNPKINLLNTVNDNQLRLQQQLVMLAYQRKQYKCPMFGNKIPSFMCIR